MLHFRRCRYCDILKFGLFDFVIYTISLLFLSKRSKTKLAKKKSSFTWKLKNQTRNISSVYSKRFSTDFCCDTDYNSTWCLLYIHSLTFWEISELNGLDILVSAAISGDNSMEKTQLAS